MLKVSCPLCGKEENQTIVGSLTQFVLGKVGCDCPKTSGRKARAKHKLSYCSRCAKRIGAASRFSLTAFLQEQSYCRCQRSSIPSNTNVILSNTQLNACTGKIEDTAMKAALLQKELETAQTLAGTYRLVDKLGEGGMSYVFLAEHMRLRRLVALKLMKTDLEIEEKEKLFREEVRTLVSLRHPCLTQVLDFAIHRGKWLLIAMELIKGETLADRLYRLGPLDVDEALTLFKQVAEGLAYIHVKGFVHKDLKPANIMLSNAKLGRPECGNSESGTEIKILDFGISQIMIYGSSDGDLESSVSNGLASSLSSLSAGYTQHNVSTLGSPNYMSPEEWSLERITPRTDLYAFGCSLYETIVGHPPYIAETIEEIREKHLRAPYPGLSINGANRSYSIELDLFVKKLLAKVPDDRFRSAIEVAKAIDDLQKMRSRKLAQVRISADRTLISRRLLFVSFALAGVVAIGFASWLALEPRKQVNDSKVTYNQELSSFDTAVDIIRLNPFKKQRTPPNVLKVSQKGQKYFLDFPQSVSLGNLVQIGESGSSTQELSDEVFVDVSKGKLLWQIAPGDPNTVPHLLQDASRSVERKKQFELIQGLTRVPISAVSIYGPLDKNSLEAIFSMPSLICVSWAGGDLSNGYLSATSKLGELKRLRYLAIKQPRKNVRSVTGTDIASFNNLLSLDCLELSGFTNLTNLLTRLVSSESLTTLILDSSNLTDQDCALITKLKHLKLLVLTNCQMSTEGIQSLLAKINTESIEVLPVTFHNCPLSSGRRFSKEIRSIYLSPNAAFLTPSEFCTLLSIVKRERIAVLKSEDFSALKSWRLSVEKEFFRDR